MVENEKLEKLIKRTYEKIVGIILLLVGLLSFIGGLGGLLLVQILLQLFPYERIVGAMCTAFTFFSWMSIALGLIMILIGFREYSEKKGT